MDKASEPAARSDRVTEAAWRCVAVKTSVGPSGFNGGAVAPPSAAPTGAAPAAATSFGACPATSHSRRELYGKSTDESEFKQRTEKVTI